MQTSIAGRQQKKSVLFTKNQLKSAHQKLSIKEGYKFTYIWTTESSTGLSAAPKDPEGKKTLENEEFGLGFENLKR